MKTCIVFLCLIMDFTQAMSGNLQPQANPTDMPLSSRDLLQKSEKMRPYIKTLNSIKVLPSIPLKSPTNGADLLVENERIRIPHNKYGIDQVTKIQLDKGKLQRYLDILDLESSTKPMTINLDESKIIDYLKILNDINRSTSHPESLVYKSRIKSMKGPSPILGINGKEGLVHDINKHDNHLSKGSIVRLVSRRLQPRLGSTALKDMVRRNFNREKGILDKSLYYTDSGDDKSFIQMKSDYGELVNDKSFSSGDMNEEEYGDYSDIHYNVDGEQEENEEMMRNYYIANDNRDVRSLFNHDIPLSKENTIVSSSALGPLKLKNDNIIHKVKGNENGPDKEMIISAAASRERYDDKLSSDNKQPSLGIRNIQSIYTGNFLNQEDLVKSNEGGNIVNYSDNEGNHIPLSNQQINLFKYAGTIPQENGGEFTNQANSADARCQNVQKENENSKNNLFGTNNNHKNSNTPNALRLENLTSLSKEQQINDGQNIAKIKSKPVSLISNILENPQTNILSSKVSLPKLVMTKKSFQDAYGDAGVHYGGESSFQNNQLPTGDKPNEIKMPLIERPKKSNIRIPQTIKDETLPAHLLNANGDKTLLAANTITLSGLIKNDVVADRAHDSTVNQENSPSSMISGKNHQENMNIVNADETLNTKKALSGSNPNSTGFNLNEYIFSTQQSKFANGNQKRIDFKTPIVENTKQESPGIQLPEKVTDSPNNNENGQVISRTGIIKENKTCFQNEINSNSNPNFLTPTSSLGQQVQKESELSMITGKPLSESHQQEYDGNVYGKEKSTLVKKIKNVNTTSVDPNLTLNKSKGESPFIETSVNEIVVTTKEQATPKELQKPSNNADNLSGLGNSAQQKSLISETKEVTENTNFSFLSPVGQMKSPISSQEILKPPNGKTLRENNSSAIVVPNIDYGTGSKIPVQTNINHVELSKVMFSNEINNNNASVLNIQRDPVYSKTYSNESMEAKKIKSSAENNQFLEGTHAIKTNEFNQIPSNPPKEGEVLSIVTNGIKKVQQPLLRTNISKNNTETVTVAFVNQCINIDNSDNKNIDNAAFPMDVKNIPVPNREDFSKSSQTINVEGNHKVARIVDGNTLRHIGDQLSKNQEILSLQNQKHATKNLVTYHFDSANAGSNEDKMNFSSSSKLSFASADVNSNLQVENTSSIEANQQFHEIFPVHSGDEVDLTQDLSPLAAVSNKTAGERQVVFYRPTKPPFMYDEYYGKIINRLRNANIDKSMREGTNEKEILTILNTNLEHIHADKGALYKIIGKALTGENEEKDRSFLAKSFEEKHNAIEQTNHKGHTLDEPVSSNSEINPSIDDRACPKAMDKWKEKAHYSKRRSVDQYNQKSSSENYKNQPESENLEKNQNVNILFHSYG